jgi:hypothetical protein
VTSKSRRNRVRTLAAKLGWSCHYCGAALTVETATLEHIWPRARGGKDRNRNLALACQLCNSSRGDRLVKCTCTRCAGARYSGALAYVDSRLRALLAETSRQPA